MSSEPTVRNPSTASFDLRANRALVEVESADEFQKWMDKAGAGDFVVRLSNRLVEGAEVEVIVRSPGGLEVSLRCVVKQVFRSGLDRFGTMVEWLERDGASLDSEPDVAVGSSADPSQRSALGGWMHADDSTAFEVSEIPLDPDPPSVVEEPSPVTRPEEWADDPVEEPMGDEGAPLTGEFHLTRKVPPPPAEGAALFDPTDLNPEADSDEILESQTTKAPASAATEAETPADGGAVSLEEAERGAEALEALLSESGSWRRVQIEAARSTASADDSGESRQPGDSSLDGEGDEEDAPDAPGSSNPGLTPDAKQALVHNETRGVSLAHTIAQMNPNEKARLASRASRQERRLLIRDHTFSVQMGLLNNPRTEIKEIIEIAKHPQTTGGILKRLASDRKWAGNYEIQSALVKHPGTPSPLAIRLLEQMRISDLRMLAKSQALRENVRKAALRLYLQRSP